MGNYKTFNLLSLLNRKIYSAIPFGFAMIFLVSGVYEVPFLPIDTALIAKAKKILFVCLMVLMGYSLRWREAIKGPFSLLCGVWALLHVGHWAYRAEYGDVYLQRLVQIAFIWILVNVVIQQKSDNDRFLGLQSYFYPLLFPVACLLLAILAFHPVIAEAVSNGLGNGRVSFSIWLAQLIFLTLLISLSKQGWSVLRAFALATPIFVLQVFTGGRTGLLASLVIWLYFSFREGGVRLLVMSGLYLSFLIPFSAAISPLPDVYPGTSIFRVIDHQFDDGVFAWLNRLSSYRLEIMASALSSLDMETVSFGNGVMNFKGWAIGYPWDVHNIYVRALGEIGIVGLAVLLGLLALPFRGSVRETDVVAAQVYCGVFLMIGMIHPELLTTAISTCMIFWLCYAESLRYQRNQNGLI